MRSRWKIPADALEGHCPNGHQNHRECKEGCPCWEAGQGGKYVDFAERPPFTGFGLPRGGH